MKKSINPPGQDPHRERFREKVEIEKSPGSTSYLDWVQSWGGEPGFLVMDVAKGLTQGADPPPLSLSSRRQA
jgi:hypothetical protein